jgi:hypothetical protein
MRATLNRVSLVIEIDVPWRKPDPMLILDPAASKEPLSRILSHEAIHYWQQLSSSYLQALAAEDWRRLTTFTRTAVAEGPGPLGMHFRQPDSALRISPTDLAEAVSRYWDMCNIGPHNFIETALESGAKFDTEANARYDEALRSGFFRQPDDAFSQITLELAMCLGGGLYARPYLHLQDMVGPTCAMTLFPLICHWCLQTREPAHVFDAFASTAAASLASQHKWLRRFNLHAGGSRIMYQDLSAAQNWQYHWLLPQIAKAARREGCELQIARQTFPHSGLLDHPVYVWAHNWAERLGSAHLGDQVSKPLKTLTSRDPRARACVISDRMLALPAGDYRPMLYEFLSPPVYRFSDSKTWYTSVESDQRYNAFIAEQCQIIHGDWERFRIARRGY